MARKTKFNSIDRQSYRLGREIERENLYPEFSVTLSPTVLRSRGMSDEEIASVLLCPVEDVSKVIDYDRKTAAVCAGSDKELVKELSHVDKFLSEIDIQIGIFQSGKKSVRGRKI